MEARLGSNSVYYNVVSTYLQVVRGEGAPLTLTECFFYVMASGGRNLNNFFNMSGQVLFFFFF